MRHSKIVGLMAILTGLLPMTSAGAESTTCEVAGQLVVNGAGGDELRMRVCSRNALGVSEAAYSAAELLEWIEKNKSDAKFIASLNQIGVGKDYVSAVAEVKNFGGGMLELRGKAKDRAAMQYIARVINDSEGVTKRRKEYAEQRKINAERAQRDREMREIRDKTPVTVTMKSLKSMVEDNRAAAEAIDPSRCRSLEPADLERLRILKVKFVDGEESLMLPHDGKDIGGNVFEFVSPTSGKGWGGRPQFSERPAKRRYIKLEKGKFFWGVQSEKEAGGAMNFKEYEIASFHEISAKDALGGDIRPFNAGPFYDQCFYARVLGGNRPSNSSTGTQGIK